MVRATRVSQIIVGALWMATACNAVPETHSPERDDASGSGKADEIDSDGSTGPSDEEPASDAGPCPAATDVFPEQWPRGGPACGEEPMVTVHRFGPDTFILRQSLCTSGEAPFMYLLFGENRVLMEDSGDGGIPIDEVVFELIDLWLEENDKDAVELVLINSHAHGDHVAGNALFEGVPGVRVVGFGVNDIASFFDIDWPQEAGEIDLGGRIVDVLPIPGHEDSHVALYDRNERLLLTGDSVYPGRLFIDDFETYTNSIERLADFVTDHDTCFVLGTHIEMSNEPGEDFDFGVDHHPDERALQMSPSHLGEIVDALHGMEGEPRRERHDDFIVFPL